MNCEQFDAEIDERLGTDMTAPSAAARIHIDGCIRCRSLYGDLRDESPDSGSSALTRRILDRMAASLGPVAPLARFSTYVLQFIGLLLIMAAAPLAILGLPSLPYMNSPQRLLVTMLLAVAALTGSFLLAKHMTPATKQWLPTSLGTGLFAAAVLTINIVAFPWREPGTSIALSWECLLKELTIAAPAALVFWVVLRRAAVLSRTAKGASIGAMAGLVGVIVLQFACIHQQAMHLLLWHWSGIAVAAGAGALAGHFFVGSHA